MQPTAFLVAAIGLFASAASAYPTDAAAGALQARDLPLADYATCQTQKDHIYPTTADCQAAIDSIGHLSDCYKPGLFQEHAVIATHGTCKVTISVLSCFNYGDIKTYAQTLLDKCKGKAAPGMVHGLILPAVGRGVSLKQIDRSNS